MLLVTRLALSLKRWRSSFWSIVPTLLGKTGFSSARAAAPFRWGFLDAKLGKSEGPAEEAAADAADGMLDLAAAVADCRRCCWVDVGDDGVGVCDTFPFFLAGRDRRPLVIGWEGTAGALVLFSAAGLLREGGTSKISPFSSPPGGVMERAEDSEDVLDAEFARVLRREGVTSLLLPFPLTPPPPPPPPPLAGCLGEAVLDEPILEADGVDDDFSGNLEERRFFLRWVSLWSTLGVRGSGLGSSCNLGTSSLTRLAYGARFGLWGVNRLFVVGGMK